MVDLSQFDLESLKGEIILRVFLAVLRYVFSEGFGAKLAEIFTLLHRMSGVSAVEYARTVLIYASKSSYRPTKEEIEMALEAAFGESYPVIAPFALEWMEEGRVKGREEGREEGRQEGAARIALLLLSSRLGEIEEPIQDAIRGLSIEQIEQLSRESRRFQSLDELSDWLLQNTKPTSSPSQV